MGFLGLEKDEHREGRQQLAVLRLLGLFDRPAGNDCLHALRRAPVIPGLTDEIVPLSDTQWNLTVSALEKAALVLRDDESLDAHPLIREHFARRLQDDQPTPGRRLTAGSSTTSKDTADHQPDTLEGLQPLYQAVAHGCHAGRYEEARADVYRDRINRGTGNGGFYSTNQLGAFGVDLGAVACFFESPWSRVSPSLTDADQAWLLAAAAFNLRALGRLREAVEPMRAGLDMCIDQEVWDNASRIAGNLSELELTLGDVDTAVHDAEQAVGFADRSGDAGQRMSKRTTLADALHHAGHRDKARTLFREAEQMQAKRQPQYPLLYSLQGFRYCDLLLADAEHAASATSTDFHDDPALRQSPGRCGASGGADTHMGHTS